MGIVILGASKGLGKALYLQLNKDKKKKFLLVSRKQDLLKELESENAEIFISDFTKDLEPLFEKLKAFAPQQILVNAGGGVYGSFEEREWESHQWTLELNLIFPMKLAHYALNQIPSLQQLVFVGSSIAEEAPDPRASSYCAAKHGLRGFVQTLQRENKKIDIRLVSPPYMQTDLLPEGSWPRREGLAQDPQRVAEKIASLLVDKTQINTHIRL